MDASIAEKGENLLSSEELINDLGRRLVNIIHATLKVAKMYDSNNKRYLEQVSKLRDTLNEIFQEEPDFSLLIRNKYFYISDIRLKMDLGMEGAKNYFIEQWTALGISGFSFKHHIEPAEIDRFIYTLNNIKPEIDVSDNLQILKDSLSKLQVTNVVPIGISEGKNSTESSHSDSPNRGTKRTYAAAIAVIRDILNQAQISGRVNIAKIKRVVQQLADQIIDDESTLIELTTLRNFDDYTYVHSVNVCIMSLLLGYHIGLDRRSLSNLGIGALLHDIGKIKVSIRVINKPDRLNEFNWKLMHKHPIFGVKMLLEARMASEATARAVAIIAEHHLAFDGSGYPKLPEKRQPSMAARIVTIADTYNAMTSGRVYQKRRNRPDEAIAIMTKGMGKRYDPLLLKTFINIMGIYPPGTVVALSSNEIGVVAKNNPVNIDKPLVKIIADEQGPCEISQMKIIDLSKESGINIIKAIDDRKHEIDLTSYIPE
jgi:HD-GYP domain-containing protein (c-di-GMP phosphodiesterase class II)